MKIWKCKNQKKIKEYLSNIIILSIYFLVSCNIRNTKGTKNK